MNKFCKNLVFLFILVSLAILPYLVFAATDPLGKLQEVGAGESGPYNEATDTTMAEIIGQVIQATLSLLGIIFIILIIISGYQWMSAGGNEEQVSKAKKRMTNAIIGLVVTISSYAIWALISTYLL